MPDHTRLKAVLTAAEGCIPHLYLDTKGYPTAGIGHMIATVEAAQKLTFVFRSSGQPAPADHIAACYQKVKALPKGKVASFYRSATDIDMPPAAITALLEADIATAAHGVTAGFPSFPSYPDSVQTALLDMAFNIGVYGLCHGYPHLKAACEAKDWHTASAQCHRNGIGDERNAETAQLFLQPIQAA